MEDCEERVGCSSSIDRSQRTYPVQIAYSLLCSLEYSVESLAFEAAQ